VTEEIIWSLEKTFQDSSKNILHLLKRSIDNILEAKNEELLPFFHEPSLFQLCHTISVDNEQRIDRVVGTLLDISLDKNLFCIRIRQVKGEAIEWKLESGISTQMTVWRVNNILDTLQINIFTQNAELYMQTGGSLITQIFQANKSREIKCDDIISAERYFSENAIPKIKKTEY